MGTLTKWVAIIIGVALATLLFQQYVLIIVGIIVLIILIRLGADLFWYGRDRGKW